MSRRIVLIAGPTAVGKSSLALKLAARLGGELISIDSVQIYRGLDIGSAKPSAAERARVPHHLIDELDPDEDCNVAEFVERALAAVDDVVARGKVAVAVGGTNLYVRVLVHGIFEAPPPDEQLRARHKALAAEHGPAHLHARLAAIDPELAARVHPNDLVRVSRGLEVHELTGKPLSDHQREHAFQSSNVEALKIALNRPREDLYRRIDQRVDAMLESGLEAEVRSLVEQGYGLGLKPLQSLGYRHIGAYIAGDVEYAEAVRKLKRDTRRFAKQQLSWLRSERGVVWASAEVDAATIERDVRTFVEGGTPMLDWSDPGVASL